MNFQLLLGCARIDGFIYFCFTSNGSREKAQKKYIILLFYILTWSERTTSITRKRSFIDDIEKLSFRTRNSQACFLPKWEIWHQTQCGLSHLTIRYCRSSEVVLNRDTAIECINGVYCFVSLSINVVFSEIVQLCPRHFLSCIIEADSLSTNDFFFFNLKSCFSIHNCGCVSK